MAETIINILLIVLAVYLSSGFIFSIVFVSKGIKVLDEGAHGAKIGFKIIIIPGCIIFWPVLLKKWFMAKRSAASTQS